MFRLNWNNTVWICQFGVAYIIISRVFLDESSLCNSTWPWEAILEDPVICDRILYDIINWMVRSSWKWTVLKILLFGWHIPSIGRSINPKTVRYVDFEQFTLSWTAHFPSKGRLFPATYFDSIGSINRVRILWCILQVQAADTFLKKDRVLSGIFEWGHFRSSAVILNS